DDLFVDELLDFSSHEFSDGEGEEEMGEGKRENGRDDSSRVLGEPEDGGVLGGLPESPFAAAAAGLESLEWLSHFVEESFSDFSLAGKLTSDAAEEKIPAPGKAWFGGPQVQTKARSKRARIGIRVWPVLSTDSTATSSSSSSSSSTTTATATAFDSLTPNAVQSRVPLLVGKKRMKKRKESEHSGAVAAGQPRRCSHCGVTKTPQWRAGPMGSKTLCNACGVRFKSGRLLPEYRPACSPTFSVELHSNSHRKVMEMRRKKESEMELAGAPPPVPSF
ncbi:hypothetical protein M569_16927, partial [Genlisea aurea]